jgi:hypothetical protein
MSTEPRTKPLGDPIAKVNDEVAVGADLEFQKRWWAFEKIVWFVFTGLIVLDVLGFFGRGPVAQAHLQAADHTIQVDYERIARYNTPSAMTIRFTTATIRNGQIQLWVSGSIVQALGAQRVIPQPSSSTLASGGILYTFPSAAMPFSVEFALQPKKPGIFRFEVRSPGSMLLGAKVVVMP